MGSIVIAMPKTEDAKRMSGALKSRGYNVDLACSTGAEVLQCVNARDYGVVISTYRLSDMSHQQLLEYMPDYFEMIILTSEAKINACADEVVKVTLPLQVPQLTNTIDMILNQTGKRLRHDKKGPGSRSEEDRKLIEDAQRILMERNGLGRIESYRYIQKKSMDSSMSMIEMAKNIISSDYF